MMRDPSMGPFGDQYPHAFPNGKQVKRKVTPRSEDHVCGSAVAQSLFEQINVLQQWVFRYADQFWT